MTKKQVLTGRPKFGTAATIPDIVNSIVFGDSGTGKTTLLSTAPRPHLVLNVDNSIESLPRAEDIFIYPDPAERRPVQSWEELLDIVGWVEAEGYKEFKTMSVDTITEAGHLLIEHILSRPGPTNRPHEKGMSQADWGVFADHMLDFLRRLRDIRTNLILTAQVQDITVDKPEGGVEMFRMPNFGGGQKVPQQALQHFSMVGYLGVAFDKNTKSLVRKLLVQPLANRRAKIRTQPGVEAPIEFTEPNLTDIFNFILGKGSGK